MANGIVIIALIFSVLVGSVISKVTPETKRAKDLGNINMIFLAEQVIESYPIFRQLVLDIDSTQDHTKILMDLQRIWSAVDQFAHELKLEIEMVNKTSLDDAVDAPKCLQAAAQIAEHLRKMEDDTDVVGNLQIISTIADSVPPALVDCGVPKTERKFRKYKVSYVRTKIDPESIE